MAEERRFMNRRVTGFTLFEVLLVIAIMAVLAAFAWPTFFGEREASGLRESATRLKALVNMCRAEAMNESRRYRIEFLQDGSVELSAQQDALDAPEQYVDVSTDWSRGEMIVKDVWIESILALPGGPPPVLINDENIEFADEKDYVQLKVQELDRPQQLNFETDGSCDSARWVLRDALGRGLEMTLDGRLGRIEFKPLEPIKPENLERPAALKDHKRPPEPLRAGESR